MNANQPPPNPEPASEPTLESASNPKTPLFFKPWLESSAIATFLLIGTLLTTTASFIFNSAPLTPLLGAAIPYPILLLHVRRARYRRALSWILLWAVLQSLAVIIATLQAPERAAQVIHNGSPYTNEMFHWIRTGEGAEGSLPLFLPIHLKHYALFCLLSLVTLSSAALTLGTWMLNYMNFYVAQLISASPTPWLAACIGWPPWSILRVIGFITTGIALTLPGLNQIARLQPTCFKGQKLHHPFPLRLLLVGIGFVIADIIVKATLAPLWQKLLLKALSG